MESFALLYRSFTAQMQDLAVRKTEISISYAVTGIFHTIQLIYGIINTLALSLSTETALLGRHLTIENSHTQTDLPIELVIQVYYNKIVNSVYIH